MHDVINPYEEDFKCRASEDTGECIDTPSAYKEARFPDPTGDAPLQDTSKAVQENRNQVLAELLDEPEKPLLQPPKILRVLLLPYEGEKNELFMSRYVYLQIENAKWVLTDIEEK